MTEGDWTALLRTWKLKTSAWETSIQNHMTHQFTRERRIVLEKLNSKKSRDRFANVEQLRSEGKADRPMLDSSTLQWVGETKAIDPSNVFDVETFKAQLAADANAWLTSVVNDFGTSEGMSLGISFDMHNPAVTDAIQAQVNRLSEVEDTTYNAIKDQLAQGEGMGESLTDLANRVSAVFDDATTYRAETIARTEVIDAANTGKLMAAQQSPWVLTKLWVATDDDRECEECMGLDGEQVAIDKEFSNGDDGPTAHPRCRCTLAFSTEPPENDEDAADAESTDDGSLTTASLDGVVTGWKGAVFRDGRRRPTLRLDLSGSFSVHS